MKKILVLICSSMVLTFTAVATSLAQTQKLMVLSLNKEFIFTLTPDVINSESVGTSYWLMDDGTLEIVLSSIRWYSWRVFLSIDGRSVLRIIGQVYNHEYALEFIRDGKP